MIYVLGFTGTQRGMTEAQRDVVSHLLAERRQFVKHGVHGDCIGADAQFDQLCKTWRIDVAVRPCTIVDKRAYCQSRLLASPESPLVRNRKIVDDSAVVIATPGEMQEELRSGTWATVRYVRKLGKPLIVVWPNGKVGL